MPVEILLLTRGKAAEYLGCSDAELEKWIKPDRVFPYDGGDPARRGMRLWARPTLDAAKPHIAEWRARDEAAAELRWREFAAAKSAERGRRKGMRKAGALMAAKVCAALSCSRSELDRWAADGRLPPDGEIFVYGFRARKSINARAWLPTTVEAAKNRIAAWREQDSIAKIARRRKPKIVR